MRRTHADARSADRDADPDSDRAASGAVPGAALLHDWRGYLCRRRSGILRHLWRGSGAGRIFLRGRVRSDWLLHRLQIAQLDADANVHWTDGDRDAEPVTYCDSASQRLLRFIQPLSGLHQY